MPAGAATTRPGNVAVPTAWVKNASRRRTIHAPNSPPATPSRTTASSARCMYGVVKGSTRVSTDAANTIEIRSHSRDTAGPPTPTWHPLRAMATAQSLSHVWPLGTTLNAAGHIEVGGCDLVDLAPRSARRRTSSPRTTSAPARASSARRSPPTALSSSRPRRSRAPRSCGVLRRGGHRLRRRVRRRAADRACAPASRRRRSYLHGNAKSDASCAQALDAGVGADRHRQPRRARAARARSPAGRRAARADPRHARRPRRHARRDLDRPGRLEVRLHARRRAGRDRAHPRADAAATCAACTCTSARSCSTLDAVPRARRGASPRSAIRTRSTSAGASASPTPATTDRRRSRSTSSAKVGAVARAPRARRRDPRRARPRARRQRPASRSTRSSRSSATSRPGSRSTAACPTTCARCSTARATRPTIADRAGGGDAAATSPASTASPATCSSATPMLDDPRAGDVVVTPVTGAYGYAMANKYNGVPRPPVVFCRDGDARVVVRRETYEDLLSPRRLSGVPDRPARPRHRRLGVRRRCSRSAPEQIERDHRPAPRAHRRPDALARRLRGDPRRLRPRRRGDRRHRPGARLRAARDARRRATSSPPTSSCSSHARRGAVGVRARARRAAALRGAVAGVVPGDPRAAGVARRPRTSSASTGSSTARRTTSSARWRAPARPTSEALARGAAARLRRGRPDRRRHRPRRRGEDGDPRAAGVRHAGARSTRSPTRASSTSPPTTWSTRASSGLGLKLHRHGRARRRRASRVRVHPAFLYARPSARQRQRAVQRRDGRVRRDHRDHDVGARRRRPADRERGARRRHQRDDPAGLDAGADQRLAIVEDVESRVLPAPRGRRPARRPRAGRRRSSGMQGASIKSVVQKGLGENARLVMVVHPLLESRLLRRGRADRPAWTSCAPRRARSASSKRSST